MKRIIGFIIVIVGVVWAIGVLLSGENGGLTGSSSYEQGFRIGYFIGKLIFPILLVIVGVVLSRANKEENE